MNASMHSARSTLTNSTTHSFFMAPKVAAMATVVPNLLIDSHHREEADGGGVQTLQITQCVLDFQIGEVNFKISQERKKTNGKQPVI